LQSAWINWPCLTGSLCIWDSLALEDGATFVSSWSIGLPEKVPSSLSLLGNFIDCQPKSEVSIEGHCVTNLLKLNFVNRSKYPYH